MHQNRQVGLPYGPSLQQTGDLDLNFLQSLDSLAERNHSCLDFYQELPRIRDAEIFLQGYFTHWNAQFFDLYSLFKVHM